MIEASIEEGDSAKASGLIISLIIYDIRSIFIDLSEGQNESAKTLKIWLNVARTNYRVISPIIKKKAFKQNRKIKKMFAQVFSMLRRKGSPMATVKEVRCIDFDSVTRGLDQIVDEISKVFPEKLI